MSSYPAGVSDAHPHFYPATCDHCHDELGPDGCLDEECEGHGRDAWDQAQAAEDEAADRAYDLERER